MKCNEWVQLSWVGLRWAKSETADQQQKETASAKVCAKSLRTCLSCLHLTSSAVHFKNITLEFYEQRMGGQGRVLRRVNLRLPSCEFYIYDNEARDSNFITLRRAAFSFNGRRVKNRNHTQLIELFLSDRRPCLRLYRLYRLIVLIALCQKWACSVDSLCS